MEDNVRKMQSESQRRRQLGPRELLHKLQTGNTRFWMGLSHRPELSAMERRALIMQQSPMVAILGCSDSRVPIEIVFDQGLGDIFVIRVAGNDFGYSAAASIECATATFAPACVPRPQPPPA
jgi:carbonic anhydrase